MNLANRLTVFRVILIPFFLLALYLIPSPWGEYLGVGIFIVASLTDFADGFIARKYNMVSNFGKFMDPLADKMLVGAALIYLTEIHVVPAWATIVIISREFLISGFRLVAAEKGQVISAGIWGKIKTAITMVAIPVWLLPLSYEFMPTVNLILIFFVVGLTVFSAVDYLAKNKDVLKN
ncbi:CDP-diacylglycerol--glycerol-3-phosphate 3-phosphatidyltransferase [Clostridiales bacterium COT073_COT-073]|nr:CDP-diacylglycerol--glycerol-3-phosphate 3-phosphatidyltransferase [Clostridiales bacterium COT073_COT-073]